MSKGRSGRFGRIAIGVGAVIVALVVLAQLFAPGIAARVVRNRVEKYGSVESVEVKAWPAVKLAWGHADEVRVSAGRLKMSLGQTVSLLKEAKGVATMQMRAKSMEMEGLRLTDASLTKHGSTLRAQGVVSEEDVKRALPEGVDMAFVKSEAGTVEVRASGGLFGVGVSVDAVAQAEEGKLVARPTGLLLSELKLTAFEDPNVYVEGVEAHALGGDSGEGARYEVSMWASLR